MHLGHEEDTKQLLLLKLDCLDDLHTVDLKPVFLKSALLRLGRKITTHPSWRNRRNRMNYNFIEEYVISL